MVFMIVSWWIVFKKAGEPGWAILIPIFNFLVILRVAGKPWWWVFSILLAIIPIAGPILFLVVWILICNGISKNFGQGAGFTVGLVLVSFIFVSNSVYTIQLAKRGELMTHDKDKNVLLRMKVDSLIERDFS
ncbi:unnamed protein product, partial [marine sediment metagenome]